MIKKVLVIGRGFLGDYITNECKNQGLSAFGTNYSKDYENGLKLNVTDVNSINSCVNKVKPDLIINCAANNKIDYLENNPDVAFLVNSEGAKNVALIATKYKIKLIHISTDSIFDGIKGMYSEEDIPNPINIYAQSKLLGEQLVKENSDNHIIIRTNFYGYNREGNFLFNWILENLRANKTIIGFDDVIFTPLEISNLSKMIIDISKKDYNGIIHLASDKTISKYQFAVQIAETLEFDPNLVKKGYLDEHKGFIAKRPKNTSLSNRKAMKILDTKIVTLCEWLHLINETI